jgi:hypothetical protein
MPTDTLSPTTSTVLTANSQATREQRLGHWMVRPKVGRGL